MNTKISEILGMDGSDETEEPREVIPVEPHEVVKLDNNELPPMHDLDRKQIQAEKQLEEMIAKGMDFCNKLVDDYESTDPRFRHRAAAEANQAMVGVVKSLKLKIQTQEKQRQQRLDMAEFQKPSSKQPNVGTVNNKIVFDGTREDFIKEASRVIDVDVGDVDVTNTK